MGACRESYKISTRWKHSSKTWVGKVHAVYRLLKNVINHKYDRQMFVKDNITQPFNKLIGCKLFGHNFRKDDEPIEYVCMKCWKRISEQQYESIERRKKLLRIMKKL